MFFSHTSSAVEQEALQSNPKFAKLHDEAILQYFSRSIKLTEIPLLGVIAALTIVLYLEFESHAVFIWLAFAIIWQFPRLYWGFRIGDHNTGTEKARIFQAKVVAFGTGLSLASVALFAPDMSIESRALITMILVGTTASGVATCLGYKPIYFSNTVPMFSAIILIWSIDHGAHVRDYYQIIVVLLALQLIAVFYGLIGLVYGFFIRTLFIQNKLESALDAEKSANAAKTRFLAAASHDLRQPLHAMSMFSAALETRPLDSQSKAITSKMNEALKILMDELDSLLDISRLDANIVRVQAKAIDLSAFVARKAATFRPVIAEKKLQLSLDLQPRVYVHTDTDLFGRLLGNLLENAVKYTQQGSISCSMRLQNEKVSIRIRDTGIGIREEEQSHIWEEFYQIGNRERDNQLGLGLGLSVVSRLANLLDAQVSLLSTGDSGSCFEITLKGYRSDMPSLLEDSNDTTMQNTAFLSGRRVLVIDDDEGIQLSTQSLLTNLGMDVSIAGNTLQALDCFNARRIECVLIDLRLGDGEDGFDVIEKLRQIDSSIPIIVTSGDTAPDRLVRADSIDCTWLVKPVSVESLLSEFNKIFDAAG